MITYIFIDNMTDENEITQKLYEIHNKYILQPNIWNNNTFLDELPEQKISVRYLTGNEKVLEIGGYIGRNTIVIGHILNQKNNSNFVCLESSPQFMPYLTDNIEKNNIQCHIENSALSKRKLIQQGIDTYVVSPDTPTPADYYKINTITYEELLQKYQINFDTLVLDCEGAFYYILLDMPEILTNIRLIIMENDYKNIDHKYYIDDVLKNNGFYVDYVEKGGWQPCYDCFYEVWKKHS